MKVFIVIESYLEDSEIKGVYLDEKSAEAEACRLNSVNKETSFYHASVEGHEVKS